MDSLSADYLRKQHQEQQRVSLHADKIGKAVYKSEEGRVFDDSPHIYDNVQFQDVVMTDRVDSYDLPTQANLWKPSNKALDLNYEPVLHKGGSKSNEELVMLNGQWVPMVS